MEVGIEAYLPRPELRDDGAQALGGFSMGL